MVQVEAWMEHRGINAAELARRLGQSRSALSLQMSGKRKIDLELAGEIAKALNVPLAELMRDVADQEPDSRPRRVAAEQALMVLADLAKVKIRIERTR